MKNRSMADNNRRPDASSSPPPPRDGKNNNNNSTIRKEKGLYEGLIFLAAILTGTACSITSKVLYDLTGHDSVQHFDKPIMQTLAMFVAMIFGLPIHYYIIYNQIAFPGYDRYSSSNNRQHKVEEDHDGNKENNAQQSYNDDPERTPRMMGATTTTTIAMGNSSNNDGAYADETSYLLPTTASIYNNNIEVELEHSYHHKIECVDDQNESDDYDSKTPIPLKTYFYLLIPAIFDCVATVLCMIGLLYLDVSIYQLLRGSGIIFVAILRQSVLKQHLYNFQWYGVICNVISVLLVGSTAVLVAHERRRQQQQEQNDETMFLLEDDHHTNDSAVIGVAFMLAGTLVQSMMFVFEEKVMTQDAIKVPPLLLFGMEGLWGTILTLTILYPIAFYFPGHDHGSFENPWTTWEMMQNTPTIQFVMVLYCLSVFGYNLFAVLVTFSLSSIWHSILDNFRPMTVWFLDLILFYVLTGHKFGEAWNSYSWLQLIGLAVLVYGTAIYNAPDAGSIELRGGWSSLGVFDFSDEYEDIRAQRLFSMGSYPSLQRFLRASSRGLSLQQMQQLSSIGYAQRAHTLRAKASPKMHDNYHAILTEQHSI